MTNKLVRWFKTLNYPSYVIFFVTARCNADCKMCFYKDNMLKSRGAENELTVEEYEKISRDIKLINILGISGGEPFIRDDLAEVVQVIYKNTSPLVIDLPTNGYFTEKVLGQAEEILKYCKETVVDVQLSIDGPEKVHDEIRGLKGSFKKVKETYEGLIGLKKRYRNLWVKGCVVYSSYNQDYVEELFGILDKDFRDLDRVVFSVVHGSVSDNEALRFDWDRYFQVCDRIRKEAVVKDAGDFHSIFTVALRIVKNDFLKEILRTKDMHRQCGAGRKVIVINETGKVFPCEPLWRPVGDLRENGYKIGEILGSERMKEFRKRIHREKCNCHWGLPMSNALLYKPGYYPRILFEILKVMKRSMSTGSDKKHSPASEVKA